MTEYRRATLSELKDVLEWAAGEGWNPGLDDAAAFYTADPNGFFVAVDGSGQLQASISVVNHTPDFAFLGLYIVRPRFRGQGIGLGLWNHAVQHAGTRTIGLDGVAAQQDNYVSSGFVHAGGTTRFSGTIEPKPHPDMRRVLPHDIPTLIDMEGVASGVVKPDYLKAWFTGSPTRMTTVLHDGSAIRGFCTVRACRSGAKIGPLIAETDTVAGHMIAHAASLFDGPLTLDIPETASSLARLCRRRGLSEGFRTARMYRGPFSVPLHANFAVPSLELG